MESSKTTDFKANVADLTKIPPNEFEKYFQEWMERDDVARSLQAKLRCDLIKNFNKTNLGKHIISHTMSSTGGSTMRLILSPLVLALNTLVAEFLYAQNCHFTLSVFCTEIPFRNTLPDFESMRKFRFNSDEICEIWQAVTGSKIHKRDLNKNIIHNYETNPNMSLLLLIIKCLLKKDPLDQFKRNVEIQTDVHEKIHKSVSAQASDQDKKTDDNLFHINKYLLTLSEKVIEMTKEFEEFAKQTHESKPRALKSSRSREYYTLNKSLERITENMKAMAQAKRKNKRLSKIVESIDNLTQQFGKCAQNFDTVTKVLSSKETRPKAEKPKRAKVKLKEKQTETESQEKSYNDWIHEMRNTENGQKFLNRVENSLRKALAKHREQIQNETDIKMKHLKSLMRLHYQQKLSKHLLKEPKINLEETRKCNDNIEKKLQQFELKQLELLQKLQESSLELHEAQLQQKESDRQKEEEKIYEKECETGSLNIPKITDRENVPNLDSTSVGLQESQGPLFEILDENKRHQGDCLGICNYDHVSKAETQKCVPQDVFKAQEQILHMAKTIAEQERSVDHIIYDAKLRIQQLENESNQLEQNFQSYLERRKRDQEKDHIKQNIPKTFSDLKELSSLGKEMQMTSAQLKQDCQKLLTLDEEEEEDIDEEFQRLKEILQHNLGHIPDKTKSSKSESSTSSLEKRNAIMEAKLKFFDNENNIRQHREHGEEILTSSLMQKQLEKYPEINELPEIDDNEKKEFNLESSLSEINIKDKTLDDEHDIELSPMTDQKSQNTEEKIPTSVRRELFPKDDANRIEKEKTECFPVDKDLQIKLRYHEPIPLNGKEIDQVVKDQFNLEKKPKRATDTTSQLIKQSMAKMQQLFEQQSKSQETLREMVNELQQERELQKENLPSSSQFQIYQRPIESLDKSLTTTMTSTTTATTTSPQTSEEIKRKYFPKMPESVDSLNPISNIPMPSIINLSSESDDSTNSEEREMEITQDTIKEIDEKQTTKNLIKDLVLLSSKPQQITNSNESSETLSSRNKIQPDSEHELGELNDFSKVPDLYSSGNDKEIGEFFTESYRTSAPIDDKLGESSFSQSSSDLEISTGHRNKDTKNLADDSDSDFWA